MADAATTTSADFSGRVVDFILERTIARDLTSSAIAWGERWRRCSRVPPRASQIADPDGGSYRLRRTGDVLICGPTRQYFDVDAFIDTYGNCPAPFLQSCFLLMKPVQNVFEKHVTFFDQLDDSRFVSNYFAMEHWVNDNIPVAGETFRDFVKKLYQKNELVRGEFCLGESQVESSAASRVRSCF